MKAPRTRIGRGILAGAAGATALAAWFLVIDTIQGEPLRTPAFLATVLGFGDVQLDGVLSIALYTVVHYALFALIGIVAVWFVERLEVVPRSLLGIILGFLLFNLVFDGSVTITGTDVVGELGWPAVLAGNVIAGIAVFFVVTKLGAVQPVSWPELLAQHYTIREGLITGVIGAAAVALWFLIVDAVSGRLLFTPAALGSAAFLGARSADAVQVTAATILGYTALHVVAFMLTGLVAAGIVAAAEEYSEAVLLGGVLLFVTFEAFSIGLLSIVAYWLVETLSWWNIAGANLVAAVTMGWYLYRRHPALARDIQVRDLEEDLAHDVPAPGHHEAYR
jgi:hypothetical protein